MALHKLFHNRGFPTIPDARIAMIEVKSFEGTPEELHQVVVGIWRKTYEGRMPFPLWSADYFDWHFGLSDGLPRDHLLTAYDGSRIAGTLLGIPLQFHHLTREFGGTIGGWLTVDPEFRRQGVGSKLREELTRVHHEQNMDGQLGYVYLGSKSAQGNPFWKRKSKKGSQQRMKKLGFWARVLDPMRAAKWNYHRIESWITRAAAPFILSPKPAKLAAIRSYQASDLPACLMLIRQLSHKVDLGVEWREHDLERHLEGRGVGRCMVYEADGQVQGFCAYHILPFLGRTEEPVGIIDIFATGTLSPHQSRELLNHCLHDMRQSGAIIATKLRSGDVRWKTFMRCGFIPATADQLLCMNWVDPTREFPKIRTAHILWR
jgi:GNAT superfamily N-acetyltransferase